MSFGEKLPTSYKSIPLTPEMITDGPPCIIIANFHASINSRYELRVILGVSGASIPKSDVAFSTHLK